MMRKYLKLGKNVIQSNFRRLPFPYKLTFAVTYRCNSRCKTCNIWRKKSIGELSVKEIHRLFKNANAFSWIDLTGGEPSLRKDFAHICEIIHYYCKGLMLLHFPTNGLLTDKIVEDVRIIRMLGSSYRILITVSTDGDEALNDKIRGIKGAWQRQLETFVRLREIPGVEAVLGMTLSPFNYNKFEHTFNSIKKVIPWVTGKDFHISLMNYSQSFYDNMAQKDQFDNPVDQQDVLDGLLHSTEQYIRKIGLPKNPRTLLEHAFLKRAKTYLTTGKTPLPCHALKSSCFIDPTGEVYPCIIFSHPLGNLRQHDYDLKNLWRLKTTARLQKNIENFKCPQCWTGCDGYQTIMGNLKHFFL